MNDVEPFLPDFGLFLLNYCIVPVPVLQMWIQKEAGSESARSKNINMEYNFYNNQKVRKYGAIQNVISQNAWIRNWITFICIQNLVGYKY